MQHRQYTLIPCFLRFEMLFCDRGTREILGFKSKGHSADESGGHLQLAGKLLTSPLSQNAIVIFVENVGIIYIQKKISLFCQKVFPSTT